MGSVIVLMGLIGFLVLFVYLKFPPLWANKKLVSTFDMMVLAVCSFLCLTWFLGVRSDLIHTTDEGWWQPIALVGALGIEIVFLGICFVLRNFWVFRPPRRPGSGFF